MTIAGVEWNDLSTLHEDYAMANIGIPQPQTPPSNATEGPSANSTRSWDLGKCMLINQIVDTRTLMWWEPMMSNHSHLFKTLEVGMKVPRRCLQEVPRRSARNYWMEDGGSRFIVQLSNMICHFVVNKKRREMIVPLLVGYTLVYYYNSWLYCID